VTWAGPEIARGVQENGWKKEQDMMQKRTDAWVEITNLPQIIKVNSSRFQSSVAVDSVDGTSYTYGEFERATTFLASMLYGAGIGKGDQVAILAENSPHWGIAYFAILAAGATTVPILPDFQRGEVNSILEHAGVRALFISGKLMDRVTGGIPAEIELVFNLDNFQVLDIPEGMVGSTSHPGGKQEKLHVTEDRFPGEEAFYRAAPDDIAAIIYTSGTTGRSKGVMLTHDNILSNAKQSGTIHEVVPGDRFLSMLPLAHTYEGTIGFVVPLLNGARVFYLDKPPTPTVLAPVLQQLKPTTILTVPLIMEKIFAARIKPSLYGSPLMKTLMKFGPARRLLSRMAAKKLLAFFGGALRFYGIGGAPLAPDVEEFLKDGKFPYAIGYGLTET